MASPSLLMAESSNDGGEKPNLLVKKESLKREKEILNPNLLVKKASLQREKEIPNPNLLVKKESVQSEKQISIDPISIRALSPSSSFSSSRMNDSFHMMLPPAMSPPRDLAVPLPPAPRPVKTKSMISHQDSNFSFKKDLESYDSFEKKHLSKTESNKSNKSRKSADSYDDEFKCNAFCLFLPSFGKAKPVKAAKRDDSMTKTVASSLNISASMSARVSLEKFECVSWASSPLPHEDFGEYRNFLFDLPVELAKGSGELHKPVSSGFLFDKEVVVKGVLKTSSSKYRRSAESSPRRVRFSTQSSPVSSYPTSPTSCITPRLRKAREEFNAFLEAEKA